MFKYRAFNISKGMCVKRLLTTLVVLILLALFAPLIAVGEEVKLGGGGN